VLAIVLEDQLSPDKIEKTLEFMKTEGGVTVVNILELTYKQSRWSAKTHARMAALVHDNWQDPMSGLFQDFHKLTKGLPRREVPIGSRFPQIAPGPFTPLSRPSGAAPQ
jgi:hypothetical protein